MPKKKAWYLQPTVEAEASPGTATLVLPEKHTLVGLTNMLEALASAAFRPPRRDSLTREVLQCVHIAETLEGLRFSATDGFMWGMAEYLTPEIKESATVCAGGLFRAQAIIRICRFLRLWKDEKPSLVFTRSEEGSTLSLQAQAENGARSERVVSLTLKFPSVPEGLLDGKEHDHFALNPDLMQWAVKMGKAMDAPIRVISSGPKSAMRFTSESKETSRRIFGGIMPMFVEWEESS